MVELKHPVDVERLLRDWMGLEEFQRSHSLFRRSPDHRTPIRREGHADQCLKSAHSG
jgi:hypothetical protein